VRGNKANSKFKNQNASGRLPVHGEPVQDEPVWAKLQFKAQNLPHFPSIVGIASMDRACPSE